MHYVAGELIVKDEPQAGWYTECIMWLVNMFVLNLIMDPQNLWGEHIECIMWLVNS